MGENAGESQINQTRHRPRVGYPTGALWIIPCVTSRARVAVAGSAAVAETTIQVSCGWGTQTVVSATAGVPTDHEKIGPVRPFEDLKALPAQRGFRDGEAALERCRLEKRFPYHIH